MKKIIIGVAVFLVLLLATLIAIPVLFKDKIMMKVKEEANKNLNAKMDFKDLDISLIRSFPDIKIDLDGLRITGIGDFSNDTLIAAKEISIDLNLMSVIKGESYQINQIKLDEPVIQAIVLKDGRANWDITKPSPEAAPEAPTESAPFKMALEKFEIKNARILYDDASMGMRTFLDNFNHELKGDFTESNFTMKMETSIESMDLVYEGVKYFNHVNFNWVADMDADMPNFKFTFKENSISMNELKFSLLGYFAMPKEDMDLDLKLVTDKIEFKHLLSLVPGIYTRDFEKVKTAGSLKLDAFVKGIYGEKAMPSFGAKLLVEKGMFKYPDLPKSVDNIYVDLAVNNKDGLPDHTMINLKKFHLEMAQNPVDMKMIVSTPVSDPNIDGEIKGKIDLSSVKEFIPLESDQSLTGTIISDITLRGKTSSIDKGQYDAFDAKGQVIIMDMKYKDKETPYGVNISKAYLNFSPQYLELSSFESKIGKSDINMNGKIQNYLAYALKDSGEVLKGNFALNSSMLDLNELMGEEEAPAETPAPADTAAGEAVEIPSEYDFTLTTFIGKLIYSNMEMTNVSGVVKVKDSKASMENLKLYMLDGSMVVNGMYDASNIRKPAMDFSLVIDGFDITKTYKTFNTVEKLAPIAKYASGKFGTTIEFSSDLDQSMEPVMNTLNGSGRLVTKNVNVINFEPFVKVADALKMPQYKSMTFNDVNVSFKFKDGRVNLDPFDVKIGNTVMNISGSNGFDQTIDYKLGFDIPRSEFGGQANKALEGLVGQANKKGTNFSLGERVKVNAKVGGTVTNPTIGLDLGATKEDVIADIKGKVTEEIDKKKEELETKAREEVDKAKKEAEERARAEADKVKKEAEARAKAEADKLKKDAEEKAKKEAVKGLKGILGKPK